MARGDKWTMWFLGRELRFEKRMADTWGDEARWRLFTLFASFVTSHRIAPRHEACILLLTLPTPQRHRTPRRRDFTINSLFYHLQDQTVEDYTHQVRPSRTRSS